MGRIAKPHGLRGDVVVRLTTDRAERLETGSRLLATVGPYPPRSADLSGWLTVVSARPHQDRFVVKFEGLNDRNDAERWHGAVLRAEPLSDPDAVWVHELIGSAVVTTDGRECGLVEVVIDNPASDLLQLEDGKLIPLVFLVDGPTEREGRRVVVIDPPDGLLDL